MGVLDDPSTNSYIDGCFDGRKRLFRKYFNIIMGLGVVCGGERGMLPVTLLKSLFLLYISCYYT